MEDNVIIFTGGEISVTKAGMILQLNLEEKFYNRVTINEKDVGGIQSFHIEILDSASREWIEVYNNDYVGNNRICILPQDYLTSSIRLVIDSAATQIIITSFEADYQESRKVNNFISAGYISDQWYERERFPMHPDQINSLTDLILIGSFVFDLNGEFYLIDKDDKFYSYEKETSIVESFMDKWIEKIKDTCSNYANKKAKLWISITAAEDARLSTAFLDKEVRTKFCNNVTELALKYDLYGIDVDWEHPYPQDAKQAFHDFMITLSETCHKNGLKCSGTVCPAYKNIWTTDIYQAVDYINWMTYTNTTNTANVKGQVPFYFFQELIDHSIGLGCEPFKILVGLPYFGRKLPGWEATSFRTLYKNTNPLTFSHGLNHLSLGRDEYYYNGIYLIQDKIAYAIDKGCAGVTSWWISQDIQVFNDEETLEKDNFTYYAKDSLTRATNKTIKRFVNKDDAE